MKKICVGRYLALCLAGLLIVLSLEGCVVMYKAQGVDAKDPRDVKMSGPEYKGKTS